MAIYQYGEEIYEVSFSQGELQVNEAHHALDCKELEPGYFLIREGPCVHRVYLHREGDRCLAHYKGHVYEFQQVKSIQAATQHAHQPEKVTAPMTGKLLQVMVKVGDRVETGQEVAIMESMKMETVMIAPYAGIVKQVLCQAGEQVNMGQEIVEIEARTDGK